MSATGVLLFVSSSDVFCSCTDSLHPEPPGVLLIYLFSLVKRPLWC